jgi:hypothetical protein
VERSPKISHALSPSRAPCHDRCAVPACQGAEAGVPFAAFAGEVYA